MMLQYGAERVNKSIGLESSLYYAAVEALLRARIEMLSDLE